LINFTLITDNFNSKNLKYRYHFFFIALLLVNYFFPLLIFGEITLFYHDKLDSELVYNQILGRIYRGDLSSINIFLAGEADLVLSYSTSPAAHIMFEENYDFSAISFSEGNYLTIEFAGILKSSKNKSVAKNFLNFMLSEDFQSVIPSTNIMYPVTKIKKLPEAYQSLEIPKVLQIDPAIIKSNKEEDNSGNTSSIAVLEKPKTKKPPLYRVIILNDDYTPMEFVVYILQAIFGFNRDKAQQIMLAIHTHGKGVCGIFTKEVAETKSAQVNNFAKDNEHPLVSDIEQVEEDK